MQTTSTDPALLLSELVWVRRLALRLTRDEAQADDLAQEAFVVAHVHPPRPDQPLRPWLANVVRNLVRMSIRSGDRRARREQIDADLNAREQATTEELLVRLESHRRLVGLVEALEEPYRTTLLLHHYEGLSSAEIARRQGVPSATVRGRLKVGHDRLRRRLDEHYGRRAAWILAFAEPGKGPRPITPLFKLAFLGAFAAAGVVGVHALKHDASSPTVARPASVGAPQAAPPALAARTTGRAPSVRTFGQAGDDATEATPKVALLDVPGRLHFDEQTAARLEPCFRGIKVEGEGRLDLDLTLDRDEPGGAHVQSVSLDSGDRLVPELEHPAVEACALDALRGAKVERRTKSSSATERVVLLVFREKQGEMPKTPDRIEDGASALASLPALGPADAPVTLVEYSDFQCAFCARAAAMVEELTQKYPTQLRVVFRQLPLPTHPDARLAAQASLAAHAQGRFWPMHDLLFANQTRLDRDALVGYAAKLGLDRARFERALDSAAITAEIDRDVEAAKRFEVRGTPTFTVNGRVIVGAVPIEELGKAIDEALAR